MICRLLLFAALALATLFATASADCSRHCYAGQVAFPVAQASAEFSFGYVPCTDTVDGHIDQESITDFACSKISDDLARLSAASATYTLSWIYNTTAACADIFDSGFGVFVNATYARDSELVQDNATASALDQLASACGSDCAERCFQVPLLATTGLAGSSSPCGPENSTSCEMVLTLTLTPCTGQITALDVLVGAARTPLSVFDPAMLAQPAFRCLNDGQLQLESEGLYVLWQSTALPCIELLSDLNSGATAGVEQFIVELGSEQWSSTQLEDGASSLALGVCQAAAVATDSVEASEEDPVGTEHYYSHRARRPLKIVVGCSHQIQNDLCCTVFNYTNPNEHWIWTHRKEGSNWFVPKPVDRDQPRKFCGESSGAFSIIWPCHKGKQHNLEWNVKVAAKYGDTHSSSDAADNAAAEAELADADPDYYGSHKPAERHFLSQARAVRTRNDCSAAMRQAYCQLV